MDGVYKRRDARNDSLLKVRNDFLGHPAFKDSIYQDSLFQTFEGVWKCVRTEQPIYDKINNPHYLDVYFAKGKMWYLDYPCSMDGYNEDVHLRNDSIFFSTNDRVYIEKKRVEFRGDTLCILSDRKHAVLSYYTQQDLDTTILSELMIKRFNPTGIQGKYELAHIENNESDDWAITDGFLDHVPRLLNFDSEAIKIDGKYLLTGPKFQTKFEIMGYTRFYNKLEGEVAYIDLKELEAINGIEYYYSYEMIK
ncbi:MAG: hypothetical protein ACI8ZM_000866 [Crocinitomix sp.]|jgi:hypothetical protein